MWYEECEEGVMQQTALDDEVAFQGGGSAMKRASMALAKTIDYATTALRRKGTEPSFLPAQLVEVMHQVLTWQSKACRMGGFFQLRLTFCSQNHRQESSLLIHTSIWGAAVVTNGLMSGWSLSSG